MKKHLHPGARWLFRLRAYLIMFFLAWFISWFIMPIFMVILGISKIGSSSGNEISLMPFIVSIVLYIIVYIILTIIIGEIYARMSYNRWFYEFTEAQLRLERGIIWKKYSNIPYERVQNVDITRGIIARLLGFSTINIQTAGFSYTPNKVAWSEGHIPAVPINEAEHIREFVVKKISKNGRGQGL